RVQRVELAAFRAGTAAPGVVDDVGAIHDDVIQRGQSFGGVEAGVAVDAVIEHFVAHDIGARGDAADRADRRTGKGRADYVAGRGGGRVHTVRRAARPWPRRVLFG